MPGKPLLLALVICAITITHLNAATVSFLVIEAGTPRGGPASQLSATWENSLMDVFFEEGHIVTNAPIMRLRHRPDDGFPYEAERDYDEAREGGMDYFIVAIIDHPAPHNVSLRLFNTNSHEMLFEHKYTGKRYLTARAEQESIRNDIRIFAASIR